MQSTQVEITQQENKSYLISGVVDFSTVPEIMRHMEKVFKSNESRAKPVSVAQDMIIDMSQVAECNSAGLTLMIEIAKNARTCNITVHFKNIPVALQAIAKAYGVENEVRNMCTRDKNVNE